jgi:exonuclease III
LTTISFEKGLRFGTWNVKTLYQVGKLAQASKIMESYRLAFLGMSEVRWNQCGQIATTKGHTFFWSGMPNEDDTHQYGVGILVNNKFRKAVLDYKFVNERMMSIRFKGHQKNLTIIQCYAPTEDAREEMKDAFYDNLNAIIASVDKNDLKILMGDFNAKVGSDNADLQHIMEDMALAKLMLMVSDLWIYVE